MAKISLSGDDFGSLRNAPGPLARTKPAGRRLSAALLALLGSTVLMQGNFAAQANPVWTGTNSNDWYDAGNWNPAAVPTNTDSVSVDTETPNRPVIDGGVAAAHALFVGSQGNAELDVQNGAVLNTDSATIGVFATGSGVVTVTNSTWTNSGVLTIGEQTGLFNSLYLATGATVTSFDTTLGYQAGTYGAVAVDGSSWGTSDVLTIGHAGQGIVLVHDGGTASATTTLLGEVNGGSGTLTVQDSGSSFSSSTAFTIGVSGSGTFHVINGASATSVATTLGDNADGVGQASVDGAGSVWTNIGTLVAGNNGQGSVSVSAGGRLVVNDIASLGVASGSQGSIGVTGANSTASLLGAVVGDAGTGTLAITNGGAVSISQNISVGVSNGGSGTVTVDGAGSRLTLGANTQFAIGVDGTGVLSITNGATVSGLGANLGSGANGHGTATVDGAGSTWTNTDLVTVASQNQAMLNISNGGHFSANAIAIGGDVGAPTAVGIVTVDGAGSLLATNSLTAGGYGKGNLNIQNGAVVISSTAGIAYAGGSSGFAVVDGAGSTWTNNGPLYVGYSGTAYLTITNGATVNSSGVVYVADQAGSAGEIQIGNPAVGVAIAPGILNANLIQFGAGTGSILFNHTGVGYVFSPVLDGVGTINQQAGDTILTATSNTFGGTVNITGGRLSVNGSIANAAVNVSTGGTLGGSGIVGPTSITDGILAPGNSPGTLTVHGNLTMTSASLYAVDVTPTVADRTNVTGVATLGGATVNATFAPGTYVTKKYTIVNATGGVNGTFGTQIFTNLPSNFQTSISYDTNDAYLNLVMNFDPTFGGQLNTNQRNVAGAITGYFNANGGIPIEFGTLTPAGLTAASGEVGTSVQQSTFNAMNLFMGMLTDPASPGQSADASAGALGFADETMSYASSSKGRVSRAFDAILSKPSSRWRVWAAGYGGAQTTAGDSATGSSRMTSKVFGGIAGADYLLSPDTIVGFAAGGGGTNFSLESSLGSGHSDLFQVAGYVRHKSGAAYLNAAAAYGWQDVTTDRTLSLASPAQLRSRFYANSFSGRVEGGYRFTPTWSNKVAFTPYVAGQVNVIGLPSYSEQVLSGSSLFALNYSSKNATDTRTEVGVHTDKSMALANTVLTLRSQLAWVHDYNPDRTAVATFQTLPGFNFVVNGAAQASDGARVAFGADLKWLNGWSASAAFEGEFSNVSQSYAGKAAVRYAW